MSTPNLNPPPEAHATEPATTESLGWQLRAALPPLRLHSLSVYDLEGEVLWLSEGALGPDEHTLVIEALGSLGNDPSIAYREDELEDGRAAVLLAARSPRVGLAGIVMILVDSKSLSAGSLAARVLIPPVHGILERLALLLSTEPKASGTGAKTRSNAGAPPALALEPTTVDELLTLQIAQEARRGEDSTAGTGTGVWRALPAGAATGQWPASAASPNITGQWSTAPTNTSASAEWRAPPAAPAGPGTGQWASPPGAGGATGRWTPPPPNAGATGAWSAPPAKTSATGQWNSSPGSGPGMHQAEATSSFARPDGALGAGLAETSIRAPVAKAPVSAAAGSHETCVQELMRLRSGSRTRRYLVLPGSSIELTGNTAVNGVMLESGAVPASAAVRMMATTLKELTDWLAAHRQMLEHVPISLSITIDARALAAEELPDAIAECVQPGRIRPGTVGFEIAEALCVRYRSHTARLLRRFEALGCVLALDDFVLDSSALELLRCKALRMVKVHGSLIAGVSRDRLCQARAVAIAQASRVLGIHASAKGVEDRATCRWLAWAGFEFVEGPLFERPLSLASLGAALAEVN